MKNSILIFLTFIGLIGIMSSCEKDEDRIIMSDNPVAPTLGTLPNLTLERSKANDTLVFTGTEVNPGFQASATYFLEACVSGNGFEDIAQIYSGIKDSVMEITVTDLNGILLKKLPADQVSSVDFRIRAVLAVDAGTGAPGTGNNPFEYVSNIITADVTVYGLPRLDLIGSGIDQKIESTLGDGSYEGYVKLDPANTFTLYDPDTDKSYGATGGNLVVDGDALVPIATGWHKLSADINTLSIKLEEFRVGLVGSATPNGWDIPDQKMEYNPASGTWDITIDLVAGDIKFRLNDDWAWNLGGTEDNLTHGGDNIPVSAGNYTISLTITNDATGTETGKYSMVKND